MTTTEPPTPAAPAPLSDEHLAAYTELIANTTPLGAITASPGILDTLLAEVHRLRRQKSFLIEQLRRKDAQSGEADRKVREFLGADGAVSE